ncbi:ABC transporter ATP-binding protein [Anabaena cylindrica FACHB-243]|uniref:Xenobiotic-transporting ATPase n=1 Tax=Anabaena cylindrica (strain ATCC 27899 / PCC 7122) TaxID=272123 RepID=K9ZEX2_ANACC|nr:MULTISPECIES: ABC transporter ATP-binding protein [Anabaena]AFZ57753.1 Xenobiotic-transporting ATPase [Anabaena cylindrica PCC 7122]AZL96636.1 xenobiotic-transporting ATPase [Anabaena sp. CCAP 1446/1C]MBD2419337.1 ABC transporter ATP-binding protein [Anabaena cylindrica FACHB-243]MBY5282157.1 ABC transporter ATP-binding protein [Anabaena sp. CCAP 1446/1C]MBY5307672.1 ABC transporter ATP-binding protein [Anabaena sp. CCAP 1446/1C]
MANFRDIINYFSPYWKLSIFSITASSLYEIIDLIVPYAIGQILNVLSNQPLDKPIQSAITSFSDITNYPVSQTLSLTVLLGLIFIVTVVRAPTQPWLTSWFHWDIALRSRRDKSQTAISKILALPLEFYDENNPGRIAGRVSRGIFNHTWGYPEIAGQLIPKLFRVMGIFVFIAFIDWQIAGLFVISFVVILSFTLKQLKRLVRYESNLDKYMENTESRTSEIITNIKTVKAFATESQELERQKQRLHRELISVDYRLHKGYVKLGTWQRTVIQFCIFMILGLTLAATVNGKISLGHFIMTLTLSSMAYSELEPISNLAESFARRYSAMVRFHEFLQTPSGIDSDGLLTEVNQINAPYKFTGKVEFTQISFGYDSNHQVLQEINLLIEPYQTVALVGKSGSGKSTLIKLLLRYFEPQTGQILIDGEDIRSLNVGKYRRRLAIVHQEVDIFNGTILDNLKYGRPEATFEQVQEACRIARLDEVVQYLPQGYYTLVGERGVRLSGGQRQRLGIARALLVEPDVLIFDEATSSLDYESERSIQLAMRSIQGTRTTIIIAHRLSTVREADKIVVLDQGKIAEIGSHAELLLQEGIYHRLHSLQETGDFID